jgi:UDP-N-acetylmuramoyl-tripeptide--D-alanyl-D-alanine ligase
VELNAAAIARITGGVLVSGDPEASASSFSIDSRVLEPGACFFALVAERDGHDFVVDAFARGATVAVVADTGDSAPPGTAIVRVGDPLGALAHLAHAARDSMVDTKVVGITGSAGKTATKDLTAAALATSHRVHASPLSFNNEAGLPLTLLSAPDETNVIVAEMGARFPGNIAELVAVARPEIGVITHVGMAHAEHLGGREGVAKVKGELVEALPSHGLAVLNAACDATPGLAARTVARVLLVGREGDADAEVVVRDVEVDDDLCPTFVLETPWGRSPVTLGLRGVHQVENAAMAAAVALALGAPLATVVAGLAHAETAALRMDLVRTARGIVVINDAYNSSPTSAAAAVRSLAQLPADGRRVAVLGPMLELGAHSAEAHAALGALAAGAGIDIVVAVGEGASGIAAGARGSSVEVVEVPDTESATGYVLDAARTGDVVLVKASRAVGLERVADALIHEVAG